MYNILWLIIIYYVILFIVYLLLLLADLGALRAPLSARPQIGGVEQTQTSHKPKLRTNPKFEQI